VGESGRFGAEEIGAFTGVEGTVTYLMNSQNPGEIRLYFKNPYFGSNEYSGTAPDGFKIIIEGGGGDHATVTYNLVPA
jgi:hypothetical protein